MIVQQLKSEWQLSFCSDRGGAIGRWLKEWGCEEDLPRAGRGSRARTGKGDEGVGEIDRGVIAADRTATGVDGDERGRDGTRKRGRKQTDERRIYLLSGDAGNQTGLRRERNAGPRKLRIGTVALPRHCFITHRYDA